MKLPLLITGFIIMTSSAVINKTQGTNNPEYDVIHAITININPDESYLEAENIFFYDEPFSEKTLRLLSSLEVYEIQHSSGDYEFIVEDADGPYQNINIINNSDTGADYGPTVFVFKYRGTVYDPPSATSMTQTHARSSGIISAKEHEGLYLPAGAFYPFSDNEMALFHLDIRVPNDYYIITSGSKIRRLEGNEAVFHYSTDFPVTSLTLTGGRFAKQSKTHDNVEFALYTYGANRHSEEYLDAAVSYYDMYTALFGPYPFDAFRIVENFFDTGFGMPGYTLLSGRLLQMPWVTLAPGSLAHEFVHNWWGNSVFVNYDEGNWSEALTTFSTNYYYNILTENDEGALNWRKNALIAIDDLPQSRRYPVSEFVTQHNSYDAVIGYQKGAFAFYELYNYMGKQAFFDALKEFATRHKGKMANWDDLLQSFARQIPDSLQRAGMKTLAQQLFYKTDIPEVWLGETHFDPVNMQLTINIHQEKDLLLALPVTISSAQDTVAEVVWLDSTENTFIVNTQFTPSEIRIDPEYQSLRRLESWEKPYKLYRTLNDNPIVVMPEPGSADHKAAEGMLQMMQESGYDFRVKQASAITDNLLENNSMIVLGSIKSNNLFEIAAKSLPEGIAFQENGVTIDDQLYENGKHLLLLNSDHPVNNEELFTSVYFDQLDDVAAFRRLFHYQHVSMVLLSLDQPGRPVAQQEIMPAGHDKSRLWRFFE